MIRRKALNTGFSGALLIHWPLGIILVVAAVLLFGNLGGDALWADEGDTAIFAHNILKFGLPKAWDGLTFTDSDRGARLNDNLVMVGTPWLPYYVTAASFAVLGESPFAARFPFALASLATVAVVYLWVMGCTGSRRAAISACILLMLSVPFFLLARQARHYALNMLLTCLLLLVFRRIHRVGGGGAFYVLAVLLYHSHPLPAIALLGGVSGLALFYGPFHEYRRPLAILVPLLCVTFLLWMLASARGWKETATFLTSVRQIGPRLGQFAIESAAAIPILGLVCLIACKPGKLPPGVKDLIAQVIALTIGYALLIVATLSPRDDWYFGIRYFCGILPLTAGLVGVLICLVSRSSRVAWFALLVTFGLTHLADNTIPWLVLGDQRDRNSIEEVLIHSPDGLRNKVVRTELVGMVRSLWQTSPGTVSLACALLKKKANPGELVITNYESEPLYFCTRLPQAWKILPSFPALKAARKHGLPDYVFDPRPARWIVWRRGWEGYQGYRWSTLLALLQSSGASIHWIETLPETQWENNPNLHFHRFPVIGYLYPQEWLPGAAVFEVK